MKLNIEETEYVIRLLAKASKLLREEYDDFDYINFIYDPEKGIDIVNIIKTTSTSKRFPI